MVGPGDLKRVGLPQRDKIKYEKEFSFYVNYDPKSGRFLSPEKTVELSEAANRVMTLLYLACTAWSVKAALDEADQEFRDQLGQPNARSILCQGQFSVNGQRADAN
jgi:hypothetical protein